MPELPEVRVNAFKLNEAVTNKTIVDIKVWKPKLIQEINEEEFKSSLIGKRIKSVSNVSKFLVFELTDDTYMLSHLRMTGQYLFWNTPPDFLEQHIHIIWYFSDGSQLQYKDYRAFGTFHIRNKLNLLSTKPLSIIAKEPQEIEPNDFFKLTKKSSKAIKTFLLDQSKIAGLGNIYANEVLWACKIHPSKLASEISLKNVKDILKFAAQIMDESTKLGGSTIDSYSSLNKQEGSYQNFLQVHLRDKKECRRCHTIIKKFSLNGRSSYYCPKEQKL
ncbi:DNA-formamidopyrimidine glycosylase [Mycoplasmopsis agassizii]|uniref:DNA-formamidopyrimidine glycosylase n=1 Tax=Mycoplasmopsis agassizii TaxID=33922 RepID=A0ABX4H5H4_9BACT|nr:DNA-formamidopyrimidine glycosylase [Mycoplasmopsis agassizii]PAF55115.1 DNA-formamidopyrimidine glycosylase [Mycoplasmopsis agassizii]SMC16584.1 DNA-(apurinic or apyrimidinic site) lyase [Mycoplasmopsis agassizii]